MEYKTEIEKLLGMNEQEQEQYLDVLHSKYGADGMYKLQIIAYLLKE